MTEMKEPTWNKKAVPAMWWTRVGNYSGKVTAELTKTGTVCTWTVFSGADVVTSNTTKGSKALAEAKDEANAVIMSLAKGTK